MKLLFDFFPVLLFVIAYKFSGIYIATAATIVAVILQMFYQYYKNGKLEIMHIFSLVVVLILGGATLVFHNELFIKWKPTALNWFLALVFLGSQFIAQKPMIQILIGTQLTLKPAIWKRLNLSWVAFFLVIGAVNLWVVYHFDTNTWVNFKLFGVVGLTLVFILLQALFLTRHLEDV